MCALASVVTMGGSFSHIGGHNPLEPALFKKPVIVGPDMNNFTEVMEQLVSAKGIIQLSSTNTDSELTKTLSELLLNNDKQETLGENAHNVVLQNQGASDRTLAHLNRLLQ
jgi:3-deoxy-D-manno-octulosonic-acid transferase